MTYYYKLIVQYKGNRFLGWQIQPEAMGPTVQGELNRALETISKNKVHTIGAGRTDAGVHALGQVVRAAIELEISPQNLMKALNVNLPDEIRIIDVFSSSIDFLPTSHAISKEYQYRFNIGRETSAFQSDLIANFSFEIDTQKMREACQILIGVHDFTNYYCEGTEVASNVREIFECEILEIKNSEWEMLPSHYVFRIVGSGFLKQMVRLLMGAIWNIGRGKITLEEFKASLGPNKIKHLGPVAPPQGLYMVRVNY